MNIFNIALMEIKKDARDVRTLVFMLAFPIVLMLILGTALSNAFTSSIPVKDVKVLYKTQSMDGLPSYFTGFAKEAEKSGIHFKKVTGDVDPEKEVEQGKYAGYAEVTQNEIKLFFNEKESVEASILQGVLATFVDKFNVAVEVAKIDPNKVQEVTSPNVERNYIKETSVNSDKQPGAMDYYAIAMTTMMALYGAMPASNLISGERVRKTADRLLVSPISKSEIFIGKIFGSIGINFVCSLVIVLFSKFVFKANWGDHLGLVAIIILTEVILATSLGLGISFMTKSSASSRVIVMIIIQLSSFFGGAYFNLDDVTGMFKIITQLSPLTWANNAISKIIYANDIAAAIPTIAFNIGFSFLLLLIAVISLQKREGL